MQTLTTAQLVHTAHILRAERDALEKNIAEVEAAIIARGPGKHFAEDNERSCTVVAPGEPGIKYGPVAGDTADAAKEIAGAAWSELFEREVTFTPKKGFEERADALLNAAPKKKLFALIGKPTKPRAAYVLYK